MYLPADVSERFSRSRRTARRVPQVLCVSVRLGSHEIRQVLVPGCGPWELRALDASRIVSLHYSLWVHSTPRHRLRRLNEHSASYPV